MDFILIDVWKEIQKFLQNHQMMFEEDFIPNDLGLVVKAMNEYYGQRNYLKTL